MKRTITTLGILMATGTPALASSGTGTAGTSFFVILFLAFGALVIIGQLIPAVMLFISTLRALFGKTAREIRPVTGR
jgi:hypothetical protein